MIGQSHERATADPGAAEQYMQAIPYDNLQRDEDGEDAYYDEDQILIEEQQEEPSQVEDPSNHHRSEAQNAFLGLSQTQ